MSKIKRDLYFVDIIQDDRKINYNLTKPNDPSFIKTAEKIKWIEFNENGTFKEAFDGPDFGRSLVLDPQFGALFTWQTTGITQIVEKTDNHIIFKTENSLYKLEKL